MKERKFFSLLLIALTISVFIASFDANAETELAKHAGDYHLIQDNCPGGIAKTINVGIYNGVGVVKTSLGYLFSINMAGGTVIVKNGPTTICSGTIAQEKFRGSCMDNNRDYCAVVYQKM